MDADELKDLQESWESREDDRCNLGESLIVVLLEAGRLEKCKDNDVRITAIIVVL